MGDIEVCQPTVSLNDAHWVFIIVQIISVPRRGNDAHISELPLVNKANNNHLNYNVFCVLAEPVPRSNMYSMRNIQSNTSTQMSVIGVSLTD